MTRFAFPGPRPARPAAVAALALLCLAGVACERPPDTPPAGPADPYAGAQARAQEISDRLGNVLSRSWIRTFPVRGPMTALHSNLVGFIQNIQADPGQENLNDGLALLGSCTEGFENALAALERMAPVADRLVLLESNLRAMLVDSLPDVDTPFPLRNRFEQGWLRAKGDFLRMAAEGVELLHSGGDPTKFEAGLSNLLTVAVDGEALLKSAQDLLRVVVQLDRRLLEERDAVDRWTDEVIAAARDRRDPEAEELAALRDRAGERKEALRAEWTELRPRLLEAPETAESASRDLAARLDAIEAELLAPFPAASHRLKLPPLRR